MSEWKAAAGEAMRMSEEEQDEYESEDQSPSDDLKDRRRVLVERLNRFKKLVELNAPKVIIANEGKMAFRALDQYLDLLP